ncbi:tetratricopeptide repeat protein [Aquibacillus kalidii]|uniref:tetratricopeptide repeat protein n=1 Tax=Aquibacillus kalidii TaxID=2762597 RepID=UPI001647A05D|nr:hypothetical protein [Aquibacillus kalidii]
MPRKEELEHKLDEWMQREDDYEEPDFRQEWVEEGINLHKELLRGKLSQQDAAMYKYTLANLYLEYGRSEKIISGNKRTAFRYLRQAARAQTDIGDAFYHLAFLAEDMTKGTEKWESVAFYAKEALEDGRRMDVDKQIKIWSLLGKAYHELGFKDKAATCFSESKQLDREDEFIRFRDNYSKKDAHPSTFVRLSNGSSAKVSSRRAWRDELIEKSQQGKCYVMDIGRRGTTLHGNGSYVELNVKYAEILKLLFTSDYGLTKEEIFNSTTGLGNRSRKPEAIKTDMNRLRLILKQGLEVDGHDLIQTTGERGNMRCCWNASYEKHLIEFPS